MAKIKTLHYEIGGIQGTVTVNCGVDGWFNCKLPSEVATPLKLDTKLEFSKLQELEKTFNEAIERYKNAATTQEIFIAIKYKANGRYNWGSDGAVLFSHTSKYNIQSSFGSSISSLSFDYMIVMKETIDGAESYYKAKLGKDHSHIQERQYSQPDTWFKEGTAIYNFTNDNWKLIPYSDAAKIALDNIQEKIRNASEILFRFIEQDTPQIESMLLNQKLLG